MLRKPAEGGENVSRVGAEEAPPTYKRSQVGRQPVQQRSASGDADDHERNGEIVVRASGLGLGAHQRPTSSRYSTAAVLALLVSRARMTWSRT